MSLIEQQKMYQSLIEQSRRKLQIEKDKESIKRLTDQIENAKKAIDYIAVKSSN